ncbi:hypothetical protein E4Q23_21000 [Candidatus Accumulibacter phosphatis]|uniref:Helix-turn-helix domain-containing protein n=1 Tax=Candidatus Accumulibacter phosphatis TaxID=327160 RepID=A0ABX1U0Q2_9PROT|nr:hypothetical protein [Candidatus Accumulibacter phosphatis]
MKQAQALLDDGQTVPSAAAELGIKSDTLSKAVRAGRLHVAAAKGRCALVASTKSERSALDSSAPDGGLGPATWKPGWRRAWVG